MENDNEKDLEITSGQEIETAAGPETEEINEPKPNLSICPNCLEPNTDGLAVCRYCGMPLHPGAEDEPFTPQEDEKTLQENREAAAPAEKKEEKKPQESGFRRVMPWLGLYIIYYAITGIIETSRRTDIENPKLAYGSWVIYIIAGLLMSWPLIKKGWNKIHPSSAKPENEADAAEEVPETDEIDEKQNQDTDAQPEAMNTEDQKTEAPEETASLPAAEEAETQEPDGWSADKPVDLPDFTEENTQAENSDEEGFEEDGEDARWL